MRKIIISVVLCGFLSNPIYAHIVRTAITQSAKNIGNKIISLPSDLGLIEYKDKTLDAIRKTAVTCALLGTLALSSGCGGAALIGAALITTEAHNQHYESKVYGGKVYSQFDRHGDDVYDGEILWHGHMMTNKYSQELGLPEGRYYGVEQSYNESFFTVFNATGLTSRNLMNVFVIYKENGIYRIGKAGESTKTDVHIDHGHTENERHSLIAANRIEGTVYVHHENYSHHLAVYETDLHQLGKYDFSDYLSEDGNSIFYGEIVHTFTSGEYIAYFTKRTDSGKLLKFDSGFGAVVKKDEIIEIAESELELIVNTLLTKGVDNTTTENVISN